MTLNEYNELRWRTYAKGHRIPLNEVRVKLSPITELPDWAVSANPEEISRGWGRKWAYKGENETN